MNRYPVVSGLLLSWFHRDFYRQVGKNWRGRVFGYLFLVEMFCWALLCAHYHVQFSRWVREEAPKLIQQVPHITIDQGVASVDADQPYRIVDPDHPDSVLFVIDTTGQVTELTDDIRGGLMTRDKVYVRQRGSFRETRVYDLSEIPHYDLDSETVSGWLETIRKWALWVFFPFAVIGGVIYRLVLALIYSLIGLIINGFLAARQSFGGVFAISVMAMTPMMLIKTVKMLTGMTIPVFWGISFAVTVGFLAFGLFALHRSPTGPSPDVTG